MPVNQTRPPSSLIRQLRPPLPLSSCHSHSSHSTLRPPAISLELPLSSACKLRRTGALIRELASKLAVDSVPIFSLHLHCLLPLLSGDLLDILVCFQVYRSCRVRDVAVTGVVHSSADVRELNGRSCDLPSPASAYRSLLGPSLRLARPRGEQPELHAMAGFSAVSRAFL